MWIQRDGALPHFGREVKEYLNTKIMKEDG
jgi:hypothetical protein